MKIVYVLESNLVCGGHIVVLQHVTRLAKRGHDLSICILDEAISANSSSFDWFPGFNCAVVDSHNFPDGVDICVATFWDTVIPVLKFHSQQKVYFVQSDETRFYDDPIVKSCVVLSYLSNIYYMTEAKWIAAWLKNSFGHNATYIPNALDPSIIYPDIPTATKQKDKLRILVEGAIASPFKRVQEAIVASQGLNCEIWCVSNEGKPLPDWKVDKFFYKVDFNKMKHIYASCDILVKLSSVEGFFGPPLEMMACGGVCVVSDVTGYDEYIVDEHNALVIPNGDVDLAHKALKRLIEDKELYSKLQKNGRITADSMQWEDSIDLLEYFYQNLSGRSKMSHVKGEKIENLRQLLLPDRLSRIEISIVYNFRKIKQMIPSFLRSFIKDRF